MNILFLIGNGLVLQYKMETSNRNFYDYQRTIYEEEKTNETDKRPYSSYIYTNHHMINKFEMWSMRKAIGLNYK